MILWDKVPINLFIDETFLKGPFKYITEEGFKLKDQKIVISKILKHDKDLEMKTLSFHCILMNFGDRTNEQQPGYVPLNPFFDSYRNCLFKFQGMLISILRSTWISRTLAHQTL